MISYAQNFEDVMLYRIFRGCPNGFYVDVGAADPVNLSVTKWFYDCGWSGINIEPHPDFYEKLCAERPRDINLNCGAGALAGEAAFAQLSTMEWSSFAPRVGVAAEADGSLLQKRTALVVPLNEILSRHLGNAKIDFLKIDVEGWELEVVRGIDLRKYRPTILLVEAVDRDTHMPSDADTQQLLLAADYEPIYFDGLNKFYAEKGNTEIRKHFELPPNIFDDFETYQSVRLKADVKKLTEWVTASQADIKKLTERLKARW